MCPRDSHPVDRRRRRSGGPARCLWINRIVMTRSGQIQTLAPNSHPKVVLFGFPLKMVKTSLKIGWITFKGAQRPANRYHSPEVVSKLLQNIFRTATSVSPPLLEFSPPTFADGNITFI